jgi:hypothetical protein
VSPSSKLKPSPLIHILSSVMSFIGYDYKKEKDIAGEWQQVDGSGLEDTMQL